MLDFVKSYAFDCCCEQKTGGCRIEYPHRLAALLLFPRRTVPTLRSGGFEMTRAVGDRLVRNREARFP